MVLQICSDLPHPGSEQGALRMARPGMLLYVILQVSSWDVSEWICMNNQQALPERKGTENKNAGVFVGQIIAKAACAPDHVPTPLWDMQWLSAVQQNFADPPQLEHTALANVERT